MLRRSSASIGACACGPADLPHGRTARALAQGRRDLGLRELRLLHCHLSFLPEVARESQICGSGVVQNLAGRSGTRSPTRTQQDGSTRAAAEQQLLVGLILPCAHLEDVVGILLFL